jgi:hypothetical protein
MRHACPATRTQMIPRSVGRDSAVGQNRNRVKPPGSTDQTTVAERGSIR